MKGRKAKPAEVKEAQGNPGRRPIHHAPDLPGLSLSAPKDLPAAARRIWEALAPELARMKLLRATDLGAFVRYCEHLYRWTELTKALRKSGETYVTASAHGTMRRIDPNFMVRDRIEGRLHELEDRFGLTPMARQQLLQKLAIVVPQAPAGDLFTPRPASSEPAAPEAPPPAPPTLPASPVGLLNRNRLN